MAKGRGSETGIRPALILGGVRYRFKREAHVIGPTLVHSCRCRRWKRYIKPAILCLLDFPAATSPRSGIHRRLLLPLKLIIHAVMHAWSGPQAGIPDADFPCGDLHFCRGRPSDMWVCCCPIPERPRRDVPNVFTCIVCDPILLCFDISIVPPTGQLSPTSDPHYERDQER